MSLGVARIAEFLMLAEKNVILAGAPGVGKTRAAKIATKSLGGYEVIVGFEGLTYRSLLVENVALGDGSVRSIPAKLSRAITRSWGSLVSGQMPTHILFDEVNRCNVDLVLGNMFTAMDLEHRTSTPIIPADVASLILDLLKEKPEDILGALPRDEVGKLVKLLAWFLGRLGGIPMPCSMRVLATMNVYDRAQLYKLGFALQRRFATIYVPPPTMRLEPKLNLDVITSIQAGIFTHNERARLKVLEQATRELSWAECGVRFEDISVSDPPTILSQLSSAMWSELASDIDSSQEWSNVLKVVDALFSFAEALGVELGYWIPVDAAKMVLVWRALEEHYGFPMVSFDEIVDVIVASVVPQLWVIVPRARLELTMYSESRIARKLEEFISFSKKLLGGRSMSYLMARGLELELPVRASEGP